MKNNSVFYQVSIADPVMHVFDVTLRFNSQSEHVFLSLPNWIPGSYMIRDFAMNITAISAKNKNNQTIKVTKIAKSAWKLSKCEGLVDVYYQVYAFDLSVRSAFLDPSRGFFNGTSMFLAVQGLENHDHQVVIVKNAWMKERQWKVASSMLLIKEEHSGWLFQADDYDELIDHPFELGQIIEHGFEIMGTPHKLIFSGVMPDDIPNEFLTELSNDLTLLCKQQIKMFGSLPSCVDQYLFLVMILPNGYGGLEHRSSTALQFSESAFNRIKDGKLSKEYIDFLTLCSHEYFHTWHIKQIKPAVFLPYDLNQESYTRQLWIFEGFTSYFEDRVCFDAGVIEESQYLNLVSEVVTRVYRGKGRQSQSVAESSLDAWTKFYKQTENAPNVIVSYYAKGKLIALCLDLLIRVSTENTESLYQVMQYLWQHYGSQSIGVDEGVLDQYLVNQYELIDESFFKLYVYGTEELPLQSLLEKAGVSWSEGNISSLKQLSGKAAEITVTLGATIKDVPAGAEVVTVYKDSMAHKLSLCTGDVLIALNNRQVLARTLEDEFAKFKQGQSIELHFFRRGRLQTTNATAQATEFNLITLSTTEEAEINWLTQNSLLNLDD